MDQIYLDNSATTRPLPEVVETIQKTLTEDYGNPSSRHDKGLKAEKIMKKSRKILAGKLGASHQEIIFTSGGTESNNLALKGITSSYKQRDKHIITTTIEHKSVLAVFRFLARNGFDVTYLEPDSSGVINPEKLKSAIREETILVSIMHVNNELGSIQPIRDIARIIKEKNEKTFFHVDGVQALGKIWSSPGEWDIDLYTISGHKIHATKGIGALYCRKGIELTPLLHGGGQENNLRSGTENIPGIAGLIAAIEALPKLNKKRPRDPYLQELKEYFIARVEKLLSRAKINSTAEGAPHLVNLSLPGIKAEVLVNALSGEGIYISTGSACHSNTTDDNYVLKAINLPPELQEGTIRISFSHYNNKKQLDQVLKKIQTSIEFLF